MSGLFRAPRIPVPAPPPAPPDMSTPSVQEAANLARGGAAQAYGRSQTILTSPQGVTAPAPAQKKTLLGA